MKTSGIVDKLTAFVAEHLFVNSNEFQEEGKQLMDEFQVEFRHVQLILLGYFCCLIIVTIIFIIEMRIGRKF